MTDLTFPKYEVVLPNQVYSTDVKLKESKVDELVPAVRLVRISRTTIPTTEQVLDTIMMAAYNSLNGNSLEGFPESRLVEHFRRQDDVGFVRKIRSKNSAVLDDLSSAYESRVYQLPAGQTYLQLFASVVPKDVIADLMAAEEERAIGLDYAAEISNGLRPWELFIRMNDGILPPKQILDILLTAHTRDSDAFQCRGYFDYWEIDAWVNMLKDTIKPEHIPRLKITSAEYLEDRAFETVINYQDSIAREEIN